MIDAAPQKYVYVRDNTDRANWGGRATSTALRRIIAREGTIASSAPASILLRRYREGTHMPLGAYEKLCARLYRRKLMSLPVAGGAIGGIVRALGNPEILTHDIEANVAALDRVRSIYPGLNRIITDIRGGADLVVNVEGDGIFSKDPRYTLLLTLSLAEIAYRAERKVHLLNGMFSASPGGFINKETLAVTERYFARADSVELREAGSLEFARQHLPSVNASVVPDALFSWAPLIDRSLGGFNLDASALTSYFEGVDMPDVLRKPYIVLGGSSSAAWHQDRARAAYSVLAARLKMLGLPVVVIQPCDGDKFLEAVAKEHGLAFLPVHTPIMAAIATLANAVCFVSGRWHPAIMAALGGTPSVFMGSNSHKTLSLQYQLAYEDPIEYPSIPSASDVENIVQRAENFIKDNDAMRAKISSVVDNLAVLADQAGQGMRRVHATAIAR